ncbi:MAG: hypothetical protein ACOYMN_01215 [Roseimicrobium sp.]
MEKTGSFFWVFAACPAVVLMGATAYAFLLGPVAPLDWSKKQNVPT